MGWEEHLEAWAAEGEERFNRLGKLFLEVVEARFGRETRAWRGNAVEPAQPLSQRLEQMLLDMFKNVSEPGLKSTLCLLLGEIGGAASLSPLVDFLKSTDDRGARLVAIEALGRIGGAKAVEVVQEYALNDPDELIRGAAVQALKEIGKATVKMPAGLFFGSKSLEDLVTEIAQKDPSLYVQAIAKGETP
jgi:hypothetical protein